MSKSRTYPDWEYFKVGDLVFPYFAGIWEILEIKHRIPEHDHHPAPLVLLRKYATKNCKPCKPIVKECDITWCWPVPQNTLDYAKSNGVVFPK